MASKHEAPEPSSPRAAKKARSEAADASAGAAAAAAGAGVGPAGAPGTAAFAVPIPGRYDWRAVHDDLQNDRKIGVYGGCNSVYFGLAGYRANVDMDTFHTKRSEAEVYNPDMKYLVEHPRVQENWEKICTFDPLGMFARRPTMACTTATMEVPELTEGLVPDGVVVNADRSQNIIKCAIDYAWNLPMLGERIKIPEPALRDALLRYTKIEALADPQLRTFLPPTGGATVYIWGDPKKLADPQTEVAVRVHDQCTGSDVFGTDICTCRPYLVFAIKGCIECAQRGGVGIVVYYQKEGRSLGEVTKYRVYNARKSQAGGDSADKYFYQTESIAGIRDARFQEMMPDVLLWLGIRRIDILLSMSNDKYDAIVGAGIKVMQRISLPDKYVPKGATVEITAKIASGYNTNKLDSDEIMADINKLETVRSKTAQVMELARKGKTVHFDLDLSHLGETVDLVMQVCKERYASWADVPYHSRWGHFLPGSVEALAATWKCDPVERARRMLDLAFVSVLLDAGAGPAWHYTDAAGVAHRRSEGLAVATFDMFKDGLFSSDPAMPFRVNSLGLKRLTETELSHGFQVSSSNQMVGVKGRFKLLQQLGEALDTQPEFFGTEVQRPGHIVDYLLRHANERKEVSIRTLWRAVIDGLQVVWPKHLSGILRGDVWIYSPLKEAGAAASDYVPFHKLSQWLTLSLLEPVEALGVKFTDMELLTGLAEYRNGGLFVDTGVLRVKDAESNSILYDVGTEFVVEWRALTVQLLDLVHEEILKRTGLTKAQLPLSKVLQGGTWAAGRVIASRKRAGGGPPINIRSDGSVF